jgi:hypothetical protein
MTCPQTGMPAIPLNVVSISEAAPCARCGAPATISEGSGFGPDWYLCDAHSLFRNVSMPLPAGYHARTLGYPVAAPHSTGHYAINWPPG